MNLIGIETPILPSGAWPTDEELQSVINQTHAQGGFVTVNHIPWSVNGNTLPDHPSIQQLYEWGVDYVEVVSQDVFDLQDYLFAINTGMGVITGCDVHSPGRGTNGWTTLIAEFTEDDIFDQLKKRRTSIVSSNRGNEDLLESQWIKEPKVSFGSLRSSDSPIDLARGIYCLVVRYTEQ
jgi:hypothetical protein